MVDPLRLQKGVVVKEHAHGWMKHDENEGVL
jgi:hypothetical protein